MYPRSLISALVICYLESLVSKLATCEMFLFCFYSKTCVKRPFKNRQNKGLNDKWKSNEGSLYQHESLYDYYSLWVEHEVFMKERVDNKQHNFVHFSFEDRYCCFTAQSLEKLSLKRQTPKVLT